MQRILQNDQCAVGLIKADCCRVEPIQPIRWLESHDRELQQWLKQRRWQRVVKKSIRNLLRIPQSFSLRGLIPRVFRPSQFQIEIWKISRCASCPPKRADLSYLSHVVSQLTTKKSSRCECFAKLSPFMCLLYISCSIKSTSSETRYCRDCNQSRLR